MINLDNLTPFKHLLKSLLGISCLIMRVIGTTKVTIVQVGHTLPDGEFDLVVRIMGRKK